MRILAGSIAMVGLASLLLFACGSDDSGPTPANSAGAGGAAAGAAGQPGNGGTAGKGGSPGKGGSAGAAGAMSADSNIVFLHHSTGGVIWGGGVQEWVSNYAATNSKTYLIEERGYPKDSPYGWENYPYDYWNIWVSHAGEQAYLEEDTLEILTKAYDVIVFKHCFPVSGIEADGTPDVTSSTKTAANYKLQYAALKDKMHTFPNTRFIVWTGAALKQSDTNQDAAQRAKDFFEWVRSTWDEKGDNIYVWDFWTLETEGGLYLTDGNATGDSHPNDTFAKTVAPYFGQRVVDVIEGRGDTGSITGH